MVYLLIVVGLCELCPWVCSPVRPVVRTRLRAVVQSGCHRNDWTCIGDNVSHDMSDRTFTGSGDPAGCLELVNRIVNKVELSKCYPQPCGVGYAYQPTIDGDITFYAAGSFRHAIQAIGAVTPDGIFVPRTGYEKATEYCSKVCAAELSRCVWALVGGRGVARNLIWVGINASRRQNNHINKLR